MRLKTSKIVFTTCLLFFGFLSFSEAAVVTQVKGTKVLIDNEDDSLEIDEEFFLISNKKKTGVIKITSVKNGKSVATVTSGRAAVNNTLQSKLEFAKQTAPMTRASLKDEPRPIRWNSRRLSVLGGFMMNSMTAKESDGVAPTPQVQDANMSGTSFGVLAVVDYPFRPWFEVRLTAGYEPFVSQGSLTILGCDGGKSVNCNVNISYLSGGVYARFNKQLNRFVFWGALGGTSKFPIAKSSTALKLEDIRLTVTYALAFGVDYFVSYKTFVPVSIEQQYFLSSETVTANQLSLRSGFGWTF